MEQHISHAEEVLPPNWSAKRIQIAGVASIVAAALLLGGGGVYAASRTHAEDRNNYVAAVEEETRAFSRLEGLIAKGSKESLGCAEVVVEAETCTTLADSVAAGSAMKPPTSIDPSELTREELDIGAQRATNRTAKFDAQAHSISDALSAVSESKKAKVLDDAANSLTASVAEGEALLQSGTALVESSAGKVADDRIREEAEGALAALNSAVQAGKDLAESVQVEALNAAREEIANHMKVVQDSLTGVQQATDEWARAQAPRQQAAGGASVGTRSPGTSTNRGSGGSGVGGNASGGGSGGSSSGGGASSGGGWVDTSGGKDLAFCGGTDGSPAKPC